MMTCTDYIQMLCNILGPFITVVGVAGNVLVIIVITRTKDMLNSTNVFVLNLAVADLMVLLVWGNSSLLVYVNSEEDMDCVAEGFVCRAMFFFEVVVCEASVLTILAIGFERYYFICQPLKAGYVCTKKRAYWICILAWAVAVFCSSLGLLSSICKLEIYLEVGYYQWTCLARVDSFSRRAYLLGSAILFFFLPLIILAVVFFIITRHIKRARTSRASTVLTRHQKSVTTMLVTLVLVFFICHLPRRVLHLLIIWPPGFQLRLKQTAIVHSTIICETMIFLHSAVNPILYNLMSGRFRAGLKNICCELLHMTKICRKRRCMGAEHTETTTTL